MKKKGINRLRYGQLSGKYFSPLAGFVAGSLYDTPENAPQNVQGSSLPVLVLATYSVCLQGL
jgi:hypothetical protein